MPNIPWGGIVFVCTPIILILYAVLQYLNDRKGDKKNDQ
jgi:hypothetical protein